MKRILTVLLSALFVLTATCFVGCKKEKSETTDNYFDGNYVETTQDLAEAYVDYVLDKEDGFIDWKDINASYVRNTDLKSTSATLRILQSSSLSDNKFEYKKTTKMKDLDESLSLIYDGEFLYRSEVLNKNVTISKTQAFFYPAFNEIMDETDFEERISEYVQLFERVSNPVKYWLDSTTEGIFKLKYSVENESFILGYQVATIIIVFNQDWDCLGVSIEGYNNSDKNRLSICVKEGAGQISAPKDVYEDILNE